MSPHRDDMPEIERIAANAWNRTATRPERRAPDKLEAKIVITDADGSQYEIPIVFGHDLGDTWTIDIANVFMAVRNPTQGVVISRLVEIIASQVQTVVFDVDGTERDHE